MTKATKLLRKNIIEKFNPVVQDAYKSFLISLKLNKISLFPEERVSYEELNKVNASYLSLDISKQTFFVDDLSINGDVAPLFNSSVYKSLVNIFTKKKHFSKTILSEYISLIIETRGNFHSVETEKDKEDFFSELIDYLVNPQDDSDNYFLDDFWLKLKCRIDSRGHIIFTSGFAFLVKCLINRTFSIDSEIVDRDKKWLDYKLSLLTRPQVYSALSHPDLSLIDTTTSGKRFEVIKNELGLKSGTLIDIGSDWGYYCHKFEELNFKCYAVENDPESIYHMKKLKIAQSRKFSIINKNIFTYSKDKLKFDVVLAFSIFHHFLRTENNYRLLVNLLNNLEMKEMYFMSYLPSDEKNPYAYKSFEPDEFVEFIIENSVLNNKKLLRYDSFRNRPLYKLTV